MEEEKEEEQQEEEVTQKIVRRRKKRRGFDWYYLPRNNCCKEIVKRRRGRSDGADAEEEERRRRQEDPESEYNCGRWADLPSDVLERILARLTWPGDFVCFGRVSRPWRSVRLSFPFPPPPQFSCPWLVHRGDGFSSNRDGVCLTVEKFAFYTLAGGDGWRERDRVVIDLPGTRGAHLLGCSHGWLLFGYSPTAAPRFLLNPMTDARIRLPLWTSRRRSIASAAVLSSSPVDGPNCAVAFMADRRLVFCRIGDCGWSAICIDERRNGREAADRENSRMAAHGGKIYFLNRPGRLGVFDPDTDPASLSWLIDEPPLGVREYSSSKHYLVESCAQVLLIMVVMLNCTVRVLKLDASNRTWVDATEAGLLTDRTVFVGRGCSFSFSIRDASSSLAGLGGYIYSSSLQWLREFVLDKKQIGGKEVYQLYWAKVIGIPSPEGSHWLVPTF